MDIETKDIFENKVRNIIGMLPNNCFLNSFDSNGVVRFFLSETSLCHINSKKLERIYSLINDIESFCSLHNISDAQLKNLYLDYKDIGVDI